MNKLVEYTFHFVYHIFFNNTPYVSPGIYFLLYLWLKVIADRLYSTLLFWFFFFIVCIVLLYVDVVENEMTDRRVDLIK